MLLGHRKKVNALCLLYEIYHRAGHSTKDYLNHFFAKRNTRASAALDELTVMNAVSFLPAAAVCPWNLLPSGVFSGDTLSFFKSTELVPTMGLAYFLSLFQLCLLLYSLLAIMVLGPFWFIGVTLFLVLCSEWFESY